MSLIIAIVRWVVSVLYALWCLNDFARPLMSKITWQPALIALGAILLIVANFNKIRGRLNLALVSLLLILVGALFLGKFAISTLISPTIIYMLIVSVIVYLLFYFSRGK
ncbi:MAG: hypothetical protein LBQ86_04025 [Holophagales bacterium]|jgi:hypothetical protein|nr:hypothetical protein [Holophagales bacterium]